MPAGKETYYVFPLEDFWMVSCASEFEAWGPYPSRAEALRIAKAVAKANPPSEVWLRGNDGRWQLKVSEGGSSGAQASGGVGHAAKSQTARPGDRLRPRA